MHLKHTQHIREKQENKFRERLAPSALYQKKTVTVFEFSRENEAGVRDCGRRIKLAQSDESLLKIVVAGLYVRLNFLGLLNTWHFKE